MQQFIKRRKFSCFQLFLQKCVTQRRSKEKRLRHSVSKSTRWPIRTLGDTVGAGASSTRGTNSVSTLQITSQTNIIFLQHLLKMQRGAKLSRKTCVFRFLNVLACIAFSSPSTCFLLTHLLIRYVGFLLSRFFVPVIEVSYLWFLRTISFLPSILFYFSQPQSWAKNIRKVQFSTSTFHKGQ